MPLFDQHLHSHHSFDSQADPEENVRSAIDRGLAGLTFTEHLDTHPDDWTTCVYDDAAYSQTIDRLRDQYADRIWIGKGVEVCYQPQKMPFILDFLASHRFDIVMLSVHYFRGRAIHLREGWGELTAAEVTRIYLETVLEAVSFCESLTRKNGRIFDVLGHLDLVKRYSQRFHNTYDVSGQPELIDSILRGCLAADLIPEINTSSLRQGLSESMPNGDTVHRYAALGGTALSLGSDSHRSQDIGAGFDRATEMLRAVGIEHIAVFKNRKRELVAFDELA